MRVIGTAGHVDHGKSTLIEALTGIHPDRLKEEQEREMTINLGFAWMTLPPIEDSQPEEIGIVDVPGHRDFIENMLAGIGGIDAALFVIAADEGVMPQTREHLAILDLLQIQGGVVAINKIDLIDDPDWLDLVEADIYQVLQGTVLADAPILRVSARDQTGLQELKRQLSLVLSKKPPRLDLGKPRLPVDRVFTIAGFGTVVTGTLIDGSLKIGEDLEILPSGLRGRVRGLQTHKQKEEIALPGSRTAVNISGISLEEVQRGNVIAHPGDYQATQRMDVSFKLLPEASQPLKHNTLAKLYIGTAEIPARIRLLGVEELFPGEEGWLQLELEQPTVASRLDRYILRRPSPGETIGGGSVVDPRPKGRHKRFAAATIDSLKSLSKGDPSDILNQALLSTGAAPIKEVISRANLEKQTAEQALNELWSQGRIVNLDGRDDQNSFGRDDLIMSKSQWEQLEQSILQDTSRYHKTYPLRPGLPREELKSRLKSALSASPRLFNAAVRKLVSEGKLSEEGSLVLIPGHKIRFSSEQENRIRQLLARFSLAPHSPPSTKECQAEVGEEVFDALIMTNQLVAVATDVVFLKSDFDKMVADVRGLITANGSITVAQARDHFNTSRRYVLAFLEYLDANGVTVRAGDERRLKQ